MGGWGPAVLFSDEAIANCHKHSGGNNANALSYSARGQKSSLTGLKSKWWLSYIPSGNFKGRIYSLGFFPVYKGYLPTSLGFCSLPPPPKPAAQHLLISLTFYLLLPYFKDPCNYLDPHQDHLPTSRALINFIISVKSHLPYKAAYSQVWGIRAWISLERAFFWLLQLPWPAVISASVLGLGAKSLGWS